MKSTENFQEDRDHYVARRQKVITTMLCKCEFTHYHLKKITTVRLLKNFSDLYAYSFWKLLKTVRLLETLDYYHTVCIEVVIVATTSIVVSTTIIRSLKFSTSKKYEKYPTQVKIKVCKKVLVTWNSIFRRKTNLTTPWLMLLTDRNCNASIWISYSTNFLDERNSTPPGPSFDNRMKLSVLPWTSKTRRQSWVSNG